MKARFVIILTLGLSFSPMVSAAGGTPEPIAPTTGIMNHTNVPSASIRCEFSDGLVNKDGGSSNKDSDSKKPGSAREANG